MLQAPALEAGATIRDDCHDRLCLDHDVPLGRLAHELRNKLNSAMLSFDL
jgi:hypothetical protein